MALNGNANEVAVGMVTGTGAAINVECGFQPRVVKLLNYEGLATLEWNSGMAEGRGMKRITAGTITYPASGGVSLYAGAIAGAKEGFTIGTDTDINVNGEDIAYEAYR